MEFKLPTETVELPSQGLLYPENSPLKKGTLEIKYPGAKQEDILTNLNYIKDGTFIDKFLSSIIETPNVKFEDLLIGDKNALMIYSRILAYGETYKVLYKGKPKEINLSKLKHKPLHEELKSEKNEFSMYLPFCKYNIKFKLLTAGDENNIKKEINKLKEISGNDDNYNIRIRFKYIIQEIEGQRDKETIRQFVEKALTTRDIDKLRNRYNEIQPDIDMVYKEDDGQEDITVSLGTDFFWP